MFCEVLPLDGTWLPLSLGPEKYEKIGNGWEPTNTAGTGPDLKTSHVRQRSDEGRKLA